MLSGQTPEAFWNSVRHAAPFSVGLNCALGAERDARAYRRACARRRHADLRLSERRPAERVRPLRREPGVHGAACSASSPTPAWSTSSAAAAARRRSTSARSPRRCAARRRAQIPEVAAAAAALRARAVHAHAGNPVRQRRRAHQRHRLGQVPQADHRRRLRRRARGRARPGRERRADHRRQHGRGPARFRSRR